MPGPTEVQLTKKQTISMLEAEWADVIVFAGSFGSAKTACASIWGISKMLQQPHQCLVLRATYRELDDTLRPEFENWLPMDAVSSFPRSAPYDCIFKNGGRFMFRHATEITKDLKGINAGSIIIDQGEDILEDTFLYLLGRLREKRGPRKVFITMNCNGHDWLWRLARKGATVIMAPETARITEDGPEYITKGGVYRKTFDVPLPNGNVHTVKVSLVEATASENPHLPDDFMARQLAFFDEAMVRRLVYLSWEESSGLVFSEFDPELHIIPDSFATPHGTYFGGMDHGLTAPTSFHLWNTFWDPRLPIPKGRSYKDHALRVIGSEYYVGGQAIPEHSRAIKYLIGDTVPDTQRLTVIYADPMIFDKQHQKDGIKFSEAEEYQQAGLKGKILLMPARARKSKPKLDALKQLLLIDEKRKHLVTNEPGAPLVYMRESCSALWAEIENLKVKNIAQIIRGVITEDKLIKSPVHALDDCCYAAMADVAPPKSGRKPYRELRDAYGLSETTQKGTTWMSG